jgi:hypothetical protein
MKKLFILLMLFGLSCSPKAKPVKTIEQETAIKKEEKENAVKLKLFLIGSLLIIYFAES